MGAYTNEELIELAYKRLEGLDASLKRLDIRDPLWTTMRHEYVALYNEVTNKDSDRLRKRFQGT